MVKDKIKSITAFAVVKERVIKAGKHYKKEYKLNAYDIFVDKDIEIGKNEKLVKVKIEVI